MPFVSRLFGVRNFVPRTETPQPPGEELARPATIIIFRRARGIFRRWTEKLRGRVSATRLSDELTTAKVENDNKLAYCCCCCRRRRPTVQSSPAHTHTLRVRSSHVKSGQTDSKIEIGRFSVYFTRGASNDRYRIVDDGFPSTGKGNIIPSIIDERP